jgi:geranylgeranyl diphosphate synthase, type II
MIQFEEHLESLMASTEGVGCPPRLSQAMRHAVFPGGARLRPRLVLAVARACSATNAALVMGAASAIELMHCASLVHDDLPCFDNADCRRGKPSVHKAFSEPLAVLAGDALIVLAFQALVRSSVGAANETIALTQIVGQVVGSQGGIIAGQAWESEPLIDIDQYHAAKTGALFAGATMAGAAAAGVAHAPWRKLGLELGSAFQVADDIRDVVMSESEMGKPAGQDATCARPNAVHQLGLTGAIQHLGRLIESAVADVPDCPGAPDLRSLIVTETRRFLPERLSRSAA